MSLGTFRQNNPRFFETLHNTGQLATYYIPFKLGKIPSDMKVPIALAEAEYLIVEADSQVHAIDKAKAMIKVPHTVYVSKIVEY